MFFYFEFFATRMRHNLRHWGKNREKKNQFVFNFFVSNQRDACILRSQAQAFLCFGEPVLVVSNGTEKQWSVC